MALQIKNGSDLKVTTQLVVDELKRFFDAGTAVPLNFDHLSDSVFIKNVDRIITFSNRAFRDNFSSGKSTIGMRSDAFLQESIEAVSEKTDDLVLSGVDKLEFEHIGFCHDRRKYLFRTYKQSLIENHHEPFAILGIARPIQELSVEDDEEYRDVFQLFKIYSGLPDQDKTICLNLAVGKTPSETAEIMGMTTRAIEMRRKKILHRMGFSRPVEIVIAMTRFGERKLVNNLTMS